MRDHSMVSRRAMYRLSPLHCKRFGMQPCHCLLQRLGARVSYVCCCLIIVNVLVFLFRSPFSALGFECRCMSVCLASAAPLVAVLSDPASLPETPEPELVSRLYSAVRLSVR